MRGAREDAGALAAEQQRREGRRHGCGGGRGAGGRGRREHGPGAARERGEHALDAVPVPEAPVREEASGGDRGRRRP